MELTMTLENIIKIIIYFVLIILLYMSLKKEKNLYSNIVLIIIIALFGFYGNVSAPHPYSFDRLNYAIRFSSDFYAEAVRNSSIGLYYFESILHCFSYNPEVLFFFVPIAYMLITIKAYKEYKCKPIVILILFVTSYGLYGFFMYKQCFAIAIVSLSFAYFLSKKYVKAFIAVLIAMMFHEAAWIVIVVYLCLIFGNRNKVLRIFMYLSMTICVLQYAQINQYLVSFAGYISPMLATQLDAYLEDDGSMTISYNYLTILKGLPYYLITVYGIINRKRLKNIILNYDSYMFISVFTSLTFLASMYMYWLWRFGTFFYFPIIIFLVKIYLNTPRDKYNMYFYNAIIIVFILLIVKLLIQYYFIYGGII